MSGVNRSNTDQYQLRLPPGLRDRLRELAEANGRSMNTEIVERLVKSINGEAKQQIAEATLDSLHAQAELMRHLIAKSMEYGGNQIPPHLRQMMAIVANLQPDEDGDEVGTVLKLMRQAAEPANRAEEIEQDLLAGKDD